MSTEQEQQKTLKPNKWSYLVEFDAETQDKTQRLKGLDFKDLFTKFVEAGVKYLDFTITEVVDWDIAPMRKFLHGIIIPAFTKKFNETMKHPSGCFHVDEIKQFLKFKFLGFDKNDIYNKWVGPLDLDKPVKDMEHYLVIAELLSTIKDKIKPRSSEGLSPFEYHTLLRDCEAYYFELFQEMYDCREKPKNSNT